MGHDAGRSQAGDRNIANTPPERGMGERKVLRIFSHGPVLLELPVSGNDTVVQEETQSLLGRSFVFFVSFVFFFWTIHCLSQGHIHVMTPIGFLQKGKIHDVHRHLADSEHQKMGGADRGITGKVKVLLFGVKGPLLEIELSRLYLLFGKSMYVTLVSVEKLVYVQVLDKWLLFQGRPHLLVTESTQRQLIEPLKNRFTVFQPSKLVGGQGLFL
mmetsp:Transcript_11555/g.30760  ORF Transcript_11555/g.30760 Transcript_11555/m.30760 type:complete len:214 (-) Transcript_11555:457-1098(-)